MLLETLERRKFAMYCHQQSKSAEALAEQFEKNPNLDCNHLFAEREKVKAEAFALVAREIMAGETFEVEEKDATWHDHIL